MSSQGWLGPRWVLCQGADSGPRDDELDVSLTGVVSDGSLSRTWVVIITRVLLRGPLRSWLQRQRSGSAAAAQRQRSGSAAQRQCGSSVAAAWRQRVCLVTCMHRGSSVAATWQQRRGSVAAASRQRAAASRQRRGSVAAASRQRVLCLVTCMHGQRPDLSGATEQCLAWKAGQQPDQCIAWRAGQQPDQCTATV